MNFNVSMVVLNFFKTSYLNLLTHFNSVLTFVFTWVFENRFYTPFLITFIPDFACSLPLCSLNRIEM